MSIVDRTHLPEHLKKILSKPEETWTPFEQKAIEAYDKKYGNNGANTLIDIVAVEEKLIKRSDTKICRLSGEPTECGDGSFGVKCSKCNPSGKM